MVVHLRSPNERYDMTYLRNYALLNVRDRLARIDGVGQVHLFGSGDYSMRVWLDPQKVPTPPHGERGHDVASALTTNRKRPEPLSVTAPWLPSQVPEPWPCVDRRAFRVGAAPRGAA